MTGEFMLTIKSQLDQRERETNTFSTYKNDSKLTILWFCLWWHLIACDRDFFFFACFCGIKIAAQAKITAHWQPFADAAHFQCSLLIHSFNYATKTEKWAFRMGGPLQHLSCEAHLHLRIVIVTWKKNTFLSETKWYELISNKYLIFKSKLKHRKRIICNKIESVKYGKWKSLMHKPHLVFI